MNLSNPIVITLPVIKKNDGTLKTFDPIVLNELDITIVDDNKRKSVVARIRPFPRPLKLWGGADYDSAGDYTQAMVEARVLELLGENPSSVLENLFVLPLPIKGK